jgi:hypothetical protein
LLASIGTLTLVQSVSHLNVTKERQLRSILDEPKPDRADAPDEDKTDENSRPPSLSTLQLMGMKLISAYSEEVQLHKLMIHLRGTITVDSGGYTLHLDGLDQNEGDVAIRYSHDGLDVQPPLDRYSEVLPRTVSLDLTASKVPPDAVLTVLNRLWEAGLRWEAVDGADLFDELAVPALRVGSEFHINSLKLVTPAAAGDLTATVSADKQAAYGVTGSARLQARGLDAVVGTLLSERDGANRALITRLEALGEPGRMPTGSRSRAMPSSSPTTARRA